MSCWLEYREETFCGLSVKVIAARNEWSTDCRWTNQWESSEQAGKRTDGRTDGGATISSRVLRQHKKTKKKEDIASLNCPKALLQGSNGAWRSRRRHLHTDPPTLRHGHTYTWATSRRTRKSAARHESNEGAKATTMPSPAAHGRRFRVLTSKRESIKGESERISRPFGGHFIISEKSKVTSPKKECSEAPGIYQKYRLMSAQGAAAVEQLTRKLTVRLRYIQNRIS